MMLRRRRAVLILSLALSSAVAASCVGPADAPQFTLSRRPIINGAVDSAHPSVVAITHPSTGQFCSGTVISNRAILSAGHCLVEMQKEFAQYGESFRVSDCKIFFGTTVGGTGQSIPVSAAYAHPSYYLSNSGAPMYDVSVWIMAQDSPSPAMAWQQTPLGNVVGKDVTFVGYGVTNAYQQSGNGTRRTVDGVITDLDTQNIYYGNGYSGTCQGDSGGPMFLLQNGVETVVGVTSYGDQSCVREGANARTDTFAAFIAQYAGASTAANPAPVTVTITAPANGSTQPPAFTVSASVTSSAGVQQAELLIDNASVQTLVSAPFNFQVSGLAVGSHQILVRGTGADGGAGQAAVQITVQSALPPVTDCSSSSPCPTGYDCLSGQCVAQQSPPTAGSTGAACGSNDDCHTGICVDGYTGKGYCSQECSTKLDCPNNAICQDFGGVTLCGAPNSALGGAGAAATGTEQEMTGGCQAGGQPGPAGAALLLLGLALLRRRR